MNLRKLCLISLLVLLVGQLAFAQVAPNMTTAQKSFATAQATGKPMPLVPKSLTSMKVRPTIWVTGQHYARPMIAPGEPWFCDYNTYPTFYAFCPKGLQTAYQTNFPSANGGAGMTIAIVDFFAYASAEANLAQFNADMHLPACTTANGCFTSVALTAVDGSGTGWDLESMLDIEYAHSMAPNAKIVYVQGDPFGDPGYYAESIAALGCPSSPYCALYGITSSPAGDVVSNSWTYTLGPVPTDDPYYALGKVELFASGDGSAFPAYSVESYPCTSTNVTCVGGTSLYVTNNLQRIAEYGWAGAGGGCSAYFAIPSWQGPQGSAICSPNRAAPDVAAIADPGTPVAVYINNPYWFPGYYGVGGTSVATPVTSGLVADIDSARVTFGKSKLTYLNSEFYAAAAYNYGYYFYDVKVGYNGYFAGPQYDLITGLGVSSGKAIGSRFFGIP